MVRPNWPGSRAEAHPVADSRTRGRVGRMKLLLLLVLALVAVDTNACANSASALGKTSVNEPPDTIFVNCDIYTQATPPRAQAMAVRDGPILAVGTNDDIRKLKGERTQILDLGGH